MVVSIARHSEGSLAARFPFDQRPFSAFLGSGRIYLLRTSGQSCT
jgi:hypothetical protein